MQKTKKEYEALRGKARKCFNQFIHRVRKNPRAQEGDSRIMAVIGNDLGIPPETVSKYVADLLDDPAFVDHERGEWRGKNGSIYVTSGYIAKRLNTSREYILQYYLRGSGVAAEEVVTNDRNNRVQKFFKKEDISNFLPNLAAKLEEAERVEQLPLKSVLRLRPLDLTKKQFSVFFALIALRNRNLYWPTSFQVTDALKSSIKITPKEVREIMIVLRKKGYVTVINGDNYRGAKQIFIHKGLARFTTLSFECPHCREITQIARDYVKPKTG